jgi:transcription elongation factor GreA
MASKNKSAFSEGSGGVGALSYDPETQYVTPSAMMGPGGYFSVQDTEKAALPFDPGHAVPIELKSGDSIPKHGEVRAKIKTGTVLKTDKAHAKSGDQAVSENKTKDVSFFMWNGKPVLPHNTHDENGAPLALTTEQRAENEAHLSDFRTFVKQHNAVKSTDPVQAAKDELEVAMGRRSEILGTVQRAREEGDLKENAGYDAAKNEQARNESRIAELQKMIETGNVRFDDKGNVTATSMVAEDSEEAASRRAAMARTQEREEAEREARQASVGQNFSEIMDQSRQDLYGFEGTKPFELPETPAGMRLPVWKRILEHHRKHARAVSELSVAKALKAKGIPGADDMLDSASKTLTEIEKSPIQSLSMAFSDSEEYTNAMKAAKEYGQREADKAVKEADLVGRADKLRALPVSPDDQDKIIAQNLKKKNKNFSLMNPSEQRAALDKAFEKMQAKAEKDKQKQEAEEAKKAGQKVLRQDAFASEYGINVPSRPAPEPVAEEPKEEPRGMSMAEMQQQSENEERMQGRVRGTAVARLAGLPANHPVFDELSDHFDRVDTQGAPSEIPASQQAPIRELLKSKMAQREVEAKAKPAPEALAEVQSSRIDSLKENLEPVTGRLDSKDGVAAGAMSSTTNDRGQFDPKRLDPNKHAVYRVGRDTFDAYTNLRLDPTIASQIPSHFEISAREHSVVRNYAESVAKAEKAAAAKAAKKGAPAESPVTTYKEGDNVLRHPEIPTQGLTVKLAKKNPNLSDEEGGNSKENFEVVPPHDAFDEKGTPKNLNSSQITENNLHRRAFKMGLTPSMPEEKVSKKTTLFTEGASRVSTRPENMTPINQLTDIDESGNRVVTNARADVESSSGIPLTRFIEDGTVTLPHPTTGEDVRVQIKEGRPVTTGNEEADTKALQAYLPYASEKRDEFLATRKVSRGAAKYNAAGVVPDAVPGRPAEEQPKSQIDQLAGQIAQKGSALEGHRPAEHLARLEATHATMVQHFGELQRKLINSGEAVTRLGGNRVTIGTVGSDLEKGIRFKDPNSYVAQQVTDFQSKLSEAKQHIEKARGVFTGSQVQGADRLNPSAANTHIEKAAKSLIAGYDAVDIPELDHTPISESVNVDSLARDAVHATANVKGLPSFHQEGDAFEYLQSDRGRVEKMSGLVAAKKLHEQGAHPTGTHAMEVTQPNGQSKTLQFDLDELDRQGVKAADIQKMVKGTQRFTKAQRSRFSTAVTMQSGSGDALRGASTTTPTNYFEGVNPFKHPDKPGEIVMLNLAKKNPLLSAGKGGDDRENFDVVMPHEERGFRGAKVNLTDAQKAENDLHRRAFSGGEAVSANPMNPAAMGSDRFAPTRAAGAAPSTVNASSLGGTRSGSEIPKGVDLNITVPSQRVKDLTEGLRAATKLGLSDHAESISKEIEAHKALGGIENPQDRVLSHDASPSLHAVSAVRVAHLITTGFDPAVESDRPAPVLSGPDGDTLKSRVDEATRRPGAFMRKYGTLARAAGKAANRASIARQQAAAAGREPAAPDNVLTPYGQQAVEKASAAKSPTGNASENRVAYLEKMVKQGKQQAAAPEGAPVG